MNVDQILQQQVRILHAVEGLEKVAHGPRPRRVDGLAEQRWTFTRDMFLHCSRMESGVYAPMSEDIRPEAVLRARAASATMARFMTLFRGHVEQWSGLPGEHQWDIYCAALIKLVRAIRALIDCEARTIVPLMPVQPSGRAVPKARDRYAAEAWKIRERIYGADQRPIE